MRRPGWKARSTRCCTSSSRARAPRTSSSGSGFLGDIIPIPLPLVRNVASVGDLFLTFGLGFFLFATLIRPPDRELDPAVGADLYQGIAGTARLRPGGPPDAAGIGVRAGTGLSPALDETIALQRPLMMNAGGMGLASPTLRTLPAGVLAHETGAMAPGAAAPAVGVAIPRRETRLERWRQHPYVLLSTNASFSALWVGQIISLFGDRVHQIALAAFVYEVTDSPIAVALTFFVGTIPNLLFSPLAGTFVDRWDQKQVLVVSDILRASFVLLIPVAILINVWLAYPLVFAITTVSIFFRPARAAVLPRLVRERELLPANSAMWIGETLADVINYPLAGLFVVFLASALPLAFWFDAVTYLASAALLATIAVPPLARRRAGARVAGTAARNADTTAWAAGTTVGPDDGTTPEEEAPETPGTVMADLKSGWTFLRHEMTLLANTVQGTAGQFALGILTVSTLILAKEITAAPGDAYRGTYAFMETAIGVGSLVGGFALGLIAPRTRKGLMIIAAYTAFGLLAMALGVVDNVGLALVIMFAGGIANMAFVIPSQTLFQERTPPELMGRVVSFRFAMVFGGMSLAMAVGGLFVSVAGPGPVIFAAGVLSVCAGLAGLLIPAVRDA